MYMNLANIRTPIADNALTISRRLCGGAPTGPAATGSAPAPLSRQRVTPKSTQIAAIAAATLTTAGLSGNASAGDPALGALLGGGIGAAIGNSVNHHNGALVGGAIGAVAGATVAANSGNYYGAGYGSYGSYGGYGGYAGYGGYGYDYPYYDSPSYYAPPAVVYSAPVYVGTYPSYRYSYRPYRYGYVNKGWHGHDRWRGNDRWNGRGHDRNGDGRWGRSH